MSKSLTIGFPEKKFWFIIAFAYFCGVNTSTMCNFQLQFWWNRERLLHNQLYMTIQASSRTLQHAPSTLSALLSLPLSFPPSIPPILSLFLLSIIPLSIHVYLQHEQTCMSQYLTYTLCILVCEFLFFTWYITALYFEKFWTLLVTGNTLLAQQRSRASPGLQMSLWACVCPHTGCLLSVVKGSNSSPGSRFCSDGLLSWPH